MAIEAGEYDFEIRRRSDNTQELSITDGNDNPVNLSGYEIAASVFDEPRTTKYADFTTAITSAANGTFTISLTRTQTATFTPSELHYDVKLKNPSDKQEYYVAGIIYVKEGYTEFP
tara:strand:- start:381 stop:728 length:348 start_codon:yes stop_codon:yes gene_type:complete